MRASITKSLTAYYRLAKPERTLTNVLTALAGFLFASQWHIDWSLFIHFTVGLTLIIASASVFNNYLDRDLDKKMQRTKLRALPSGRITQLNAVVYATVLGVVGFWILMDTNWLTVAIIAFAYFSYVVLYGLAKRATIHSTLIGTIPGAASLVAGYTAVTNSLDATAIILFFIMLCWQMVHFYAIAVYRLDDYRAAGMPTMPGKSGIKSTKYQMLGYLVGFIVSSVFLVVFGGAGFIFLLSVGALGLFWLWMTLKGFNDKDSGSWARGVFKFSLIVIVALSLLISLGSVLP